jgi:hypothetical protein
MAADEYRPRAKISLQIHILLLRCKLGYALLTDHGLLLFKNISDHLMILISRIKKGHKMFQKIDDKNEVQKYVNSIHP